MAGTTRRKTKVILGEVFGRVNKNPPIRKLRVVAQAVTRAANRSIKRAHIFLGKAAHTIAVMATFPRKIQTNLVERRKIPSTITTAEFTRTFGHATGKTPVRKLQTVLQAMAKRTIQQRIKTHSFIGKAIKIVSGMVYTDYGAPFLFTEDHWRTIRVVLEVYMKAVVGTIFARVIDKTSGLPVANSEVNTAVVTFQRIRSLELTLIDTHEYQIQFGKVLGHSGEALSGRLIIINE